MTSSFKQSVNELADALRAIKSSLAEEGSPDNSKAVPIHEFTKGRRGPYYIVKARDLGDREYQTLMIASPVDYRIHPSTRAAVDDFSDQWDAAVKDLEQKLAAAEAGEDPEAVQEAAWNLDDVIAAMPDWHIAFIEDEHFITVGY